MSMNAEEEFNIERYEVICPDCQGERVCDDCEGTGKWPGMDCPYCGGTLICGHCKGNGFITEWD